MDRTRRPPVQQGRLHPLAAEPQRQFGRHRQAGETLYRAQVVPRPAGMVATDEKVFVRPLAGPPRPLAAPTNSQLVTRRRINSATAIVAIER